MATVTQTKSLERWGWWVLATSAALVGIYALAFFLIDELNAGIKTHFEGMRMGAMLHIVPGGVAILVGIAQFSERLRRSQPKLHRILGQLYFICVGVSAVAAIFISFRPLGGAVGGFGLGMLALVWLYTGWQAYAAARRREFLEHQRWMMRNYALTLAAVTIRIYISGFPAMGWMSFEEVYPLATWLCWVPNLLLVEWWLIKRISSGREA